MNDTPFIGELDTLIRARYPIIAVETHEEERLRALLNQLARSPRHQEKGLYAWSRPRGLVQVVGTGNGVKPIPGTEDPLSVLEYIADQTTGLYLLADFAPYLAPYGQEEPMLVRLLRELAWHVKETTATVIISGPNWPDVKTLEKEVRVIELPLPDEEEIGHLTDGQIARICDNPNVMVDLDGNREQLTAALLGLTTGEIENALASATIRHRGLSAQAIPTILDEKRAVIRQSGALTYTHPEPADHLGGYHHIRRLLEEAAATFSPAAREFGVEPSKGLLLVGLPGTGKDLCKRIASSMLGRPLLDLDFGSVMGEGGGVIGQAEMSVKRALSIATTIRGILGISEFEKGLSGLASSGQTDGGTTARTIGYLLNWMQEQTAVFVMATANDVRALRPEQIRQGRFSQIVFVDLPNPEDRADIFRVHLARRQRDPGQHDLQSLAAASNGFSGAEIEAAVKGAILDTWMEGAVPLTDAHILHRIGAIRPTSEVKREEIEELRKWAFDHLVVTTEATTQGPAPGRRLEI